MKWEKLICAERQQAKEEKPKQFEQFDIDAFDDDFLSIICLLYTSDAADE